MGTRLLNYFGNIAHLVPPGTHPPAAAAPARAPAIEAADAPRARAPAATPLPKNLMDSRSFVR